MLEQLPFGCIGEAVELEHVLANVQVGLEGYLVGAVGAPKHARGRGDQVADAVHVQDEAVRAARDRLAPEPRDHPATLSSGGASAWQIATASASEA